jgi:hypothetical protein
MRTLTRTRHPFAPDDLVRAIEPFSGSLDGAPFVCNPSDAPLRGDNPIVLSYPRYFAREGDVAARAAYFAEQEAERAAERQRQRDEEAKERAEFQKKVAKRADELERQEALADERDRQYLAAQIAAGKERRERQEREAAQDAEKQVEWAAAAEVARRLANHEAAA